MKENSKALAAGRRIVGRALGWLLIWLAGAGLALWLKSSFIAVALAVAGMWILFSAFTFYFFRDPEPRVPIAPEAVIAPAHGLVDCLDETTEPEFLNGPYRRISIFSRYWTCMCKTRLWPAKLSLSNIVPAGF